MGSYTTVLDRNGLKGARIGILRESIGVNSEPGSDDFKKVDAVFEKNVAELKAAGAILVDPVVIPDLKALLARRARQSGHGRRGAQALSRAQSGFAVQDAPGHRQLAGHRQELSGRPRSARWKTPPPPLDPAKYLDYIEARDQLMVNSPQGDGRQ